MTRPELHALVDMVMDARDKGIMMAFINFYDDVNVYDLKNVIESDMWSSDFETFSDFTKAVEEYIKTLETK